MKLWHCGGSRSLRPLWTLEEMGLPYELEVLRFPPRVFHKEYLRINALGTVPFFVDGEVELTESTAICHYLVRRYGPTPLALEADEPGYGAWLNWLYQADATYTFPQTLYLRYTMLEPSPEKAPVGEDYARWFIARLRHLDQHLLRHSWLSAERFTIADIAVGYALQLGQQLGLDTRYEPQTLAYLERLQARPAFQRAQARTPAAPLTP